MGSGKQAYLPQTNRSRFINSKEHLEKEYLQGGAETVATAVEIATIQQRYWV